MTKVSIVTPVFNGACFITDAMNSILAQTYQDWEWIIVNDGSTDSTAALLERLDDPRIRVIHQVNAGTSAARNTGLEHVRGEYITFLDADDLLTPKALERRAAFLDTHSKVDIVNGGVHVTSQGKLMRDYRPDLSQGPLLNRLARLEEGVFFSVNYMIRRLKIGNHRFPEGVSHCEDLIFFLTLAHDEALCYGAVSDTVYDYRVQASSAMSNLEGIERGYLELIRHSGTLPRITPSARRVQIRRVRRILIRSWLRKLRVDHAISVLFKLRRAQRPDISSAEKAV